MDLEPVIILAVDKIMNRVQEGCWEWVFRGALHSEATKDKWWSEGMFPGRIILDFW